MRPLRAFTLAMGLAALGALLAAETIIPGAADYTGIWQLDADASREVLMKHYPAEQVEFGLQQLKGNTVVFDDQANFVTFTSGGMNSLGACEWENSEEGPLDLKACFDAAGNEVDPAKFGIVTVYSNGTLSVTSGGDDDLIFRKKED